jgi:hypothetical protein
MSEIDDYLREIDTINRKGRVNIHDRVIEIRKKYVENKKKIKQAQKEQRLNKKQGININADPFVPRKLRFGKCGPANLALYNRIKNDVKRKVKRWPSAYASGQLVRRYKSSGGKYRNSCSRFGNLKDWYDQEWRDVCTGLPCGRKKGEKRKYPYCRPTRTVGKTPRRMSQLTKAQIRERCKRKRLIKGKRLNNFGKGNLDPMLLQASPLLLNLKNTKSILQLRKNIIRSCQGQPWDKIWTYIISNGITDITKIKYVLKTKKYNVNKTPSKVYQKYIKGPNAVSSFYSPGGTLLVIPNKPYINITDFAYHATQKEWISLWRRVAKETKKMKRPFYISTHGHGVNWLHVRLENKLRYNSFGGKFKDLVEKHKQTLKEFPRRVMDLKEFDKNELLQNLYVSQYFTAISKSRLIDDYKEFYISVKNKYGLLRLITRGYDLELFSFYKNEYNESNGSMRCMLLFVLEELLEIGLINYNESIIEVSEPLDESIRTYIDIGFIRNKNYQGKVMLYSPINKLMRILQKQCTSSH